MQKNKPRFLVETWLQEETVWQISLEKLTTRRTIVIAAEK
jgi:hypothetical protein